MNAFAFYNLSIIKRLLPHLIKAEQQPHIIDTVCLFRFELSLNTTLSVAAGKCLNLFS